MNMKKFNWFFLMLLLALVPVVQSCDDDDDDYYVVYPYSSWDWATVHTTGGGGYYLEGDRYEIIDPIMTSIPWYRPVDGQRVVAYFDPLANTKDGIQVNMQGVQEVLTKTVEQMTAANEDEYGNDPIVIYQGDMWLGGNYLNIIFEQNLPASNKHRISLVQKVEAVPYDNADDTQEEGGDAGEGTESGEGDSETNVVLDADGYVNLELRYNTYGDVTNRYDWGFVSYNLEPFYPTDEATQAAMKGFKVTINSKENGEGVVVVLDLDHPVGVPEKAKEIHKMSSLLR